MDTEDYIIIGKFVWYLFCGLGSIAVIGLIIKGILWLVKKPANMD